MTQRPPKFVLELDVEDALCLATILAYCLSHCLYNFKMCRDKPTQDVMKETEVFFYNNMERAGDFIGALSLEIAKYVDGIEGGKNL